ncbi:MAG TPA: NrsF family protein [Vicinamibacterales bacterium]|nr:NrsF family protein [Vicinamibacterales bacterium]
MTDDALRLSQELRDRLAADFQPVRPLRSPWMRTLVVVPVAVIALFAASITFNVRSDAERLGWIGVWGLSVLQFAIGLGVVAAALRESVPGRGWSRAAIAAWLAIPLGAMIAITLFSWETSQVMVRRQWWLVAGLCFSGSAATALPVVALSAILAARAYPTRPAIAGALFGAGSGLIADAGWRVFCHFGEPAHVLSAHLAAVVMSAAIGSLLSMRLARA